MNALLIAGWLAWMFGAGALLEAGGESRWGTVGFSIAFLLFVVHIAGLFVQWRRERKRPTVTVTHTADVSAFERAMSDMGRSVSELTERRDRRRTR